MVMFLHVLVFMTFFIGKNTSICYSYESKDIFYNISMLLPDSIANILTKHNSRYIKTNLHEDCPISEPPSTAINDIQSSRNKR